MKELIITNEAGEKFERITRTRAKSLFYMKYPVYSTYQDGEPFPFNPGKDERDFCLTESHKAQFKYFIKLEESK